MKKTLFSKDGFTIGWFMLLGGLSSCRSTVKLDLHAANIIVSRQVPRECEDRGAVEGRSYSQNQGEALSWATYDLKNEAAARGANYIRLETRRSSAWNDNPNIVEIHLIGRALKCGKRPRVNLKEVSGAPQKR